MVLKGTVQEGASISDFCNLSLRPIKCATIGISMSIAAACHQSELRSYPIDGVEVPYMEYGERDGRVPLVLLHGISMPCTRWGGFPEALERHTYAIGLPERHPIKVPTMKGYAKVMAEAMHHIAGPYADVLGLSWGGLLAQRLAIDDRPHMRKLVLAGTMPATPAAFGAYPDPRAALGVMSTRRTPRTAAMVYGGDVREHPELVEDLGIDRDINMFHHMRQQWAVMLSGSMIMKRMAQRDKPETLVMTGDDDPLMRYRHVRLGAYLLGAELETIPQGGHGFLLTRPKESARIVNEFLDRPSN